MSNQSKCTFTLEKLSTVEKFLNENSYYQSDYKTDWLDVALLTYKNNDQVLTLFADDFTQDVVATGKSEIITKIKSLVEDK